MFCAKLHVVGQANGAETAGLQRPPAYSLYHRTNPRSQGLPPRVTNTLHLRSVVWSAVLRVVWPVHITVGWYF
jgi:hypothetical protein